MQSPGSQQALKDIQGYSERVQKERILQEELKQRNFENMLNLQKLGMAERELTNKLQRLDALKNVGEKISKGEYWLQGYPKGEMGVDVLGAIFQSGNVPTEKDYDLTKDFSSLWQGMGFPYNESQALKNVKPNDQLIAQRLVDLGLGKLDTKKLEATLKEHGLGDDVLPYVLVNISQGRPPLDNMGSMLAKRLDLLQQGKKQGSTLDKGYELYQKMLTKPEIAKELGLETLDLNSWMLYYLDHTKYIDYVMNALDKGQDLQEASNDFFSRYPEPETLTEILTNFVNIYYIEPGKRALNWGKNLLSPGEPQEPTAQPLNLFNQNSKWEQTVNAVMNEYNVKRDAAIQMLRDANYREQ